MIYFYFFAFRVEDQKFKFITFLHFFPNYLLLSLSTFLLTVIQKFETLLMNLVLLFNISYHFNHFFFYIQIKFFLF